MEKRIRLLGQKFLDLNPSAPAARRQNAPRPPVHPPLQRRIVTVFNKSSVWAMLAVACLLSGGCVGPHYTKSPLVLWGECPPEIPSGDVSAVKRHLSTKAAPKVNCLAVVTGFASTPLKCVGLQGWKDYGMYAEARGVVVQNQVSSDRFFTVDLKLNSMKIGNDSIPISDSTFMRLEIFLGNVRVERKAITNTASLVVTGKFTWDTDGWFEIHPQNKSDVHVEPKQ